MTRDLNSPLPRPLLFSGILAVLLLVVPARQPAAATAVPAFQILPRLGLGLEYGGFLHSGSDFASQLRRRLEIDALQYRQHLLYLEIDEETAWGSADRAGVFNRVRHRLYLGGYRYDLGDYYLGLMFYHRCHNPFHTADLRGYVGRSRENLYLVGVEFLSKAMRLGMKDRQIDFAPDQPWELLGHLHGAVAVHKVVQREYSDLDWLLQGRLRCDLFRYRLLVPYVEAGGEAYGRNAWRFSAYAETGVRIHGPQLNFTPYFKYERLQEFLVQADNRSFRPQGRDQVFGGARLEVLLDERYSGAASADSWQLLPEVHGLAAYALYLGSKYHKGLGDLQLNFDLLRYRPVTLFVNTSLVFDTRKEDFKPETVSYGLEYGLRLRSDRYFLEPFLAHGRRLDANFYKNIDERTNQAGLRLGTLGSRPGYYNTGIDFREPAWQWLNHWHWQLQAGHYFRNRDWGYNWDLQALVRWDLARLAFVVPYLEGRGRGQLGRGSNPDAWEYALEFGGRAHGTFDLALFLRWQRQQNIFVFRGPRENQGIFGLKAIF